MRSSTRITRSSARAAQANINANKPTTSSSRSKQRSANDENSICSPVVGLSPRTRGLLLRSPQEEANQVLVNQRFKILVGEDDRSGKHANVAFATRSPFTPSRKFAIKIQPIASPTNLYDRAYRELIIFEELRKLQENTDYFPNRNCNFVSLLEWFKAKNSIEGDDELLMHYVMECADMTLNDLKQTTLYQFKCILFQILFGLHVAQKESEFVHNDLHMKNVLLFRPKKQNEVHQFRDGSDVWFTTGYHVKITDFGLSRIRVGNSVIFNPKNPMAELFDQNTDVDKIVHEMARVKVLSNSWVTEESDLSPPSKTLLANERRKELANLRQMVQRGAPLEKVLRHKFFNDLRKPPQPFSGSFGEVVEKENKVTRSNAGVSRGTVSTPFKFKM